MNLTGRKQRDPAVASSTATWAHRDSATFSLNHTEHATIGGNAYSKECFMEIARTMQHCLEIKDRKYHLKTYKNCFVGSDAIDFLQRFLQLASRDEAVAVAQEMNDTVHCCEHVVHDHGDQLKDEYLFYRFTEFSTKRSFTLPEVMRAFQLGIKLSDRQYRLRTYPQVFVGKEAVDFLVRFKFAASRQEAVQLGRRLQQEFQLFVHVTGEHPFEDEFIFFKMLTPKFRSIDEAKKREQQALKQWLAFFTLVASVIYYYIF